MAIRSLQTIRTVNDAVQRDEKRFNTNCNSLPESIELTIIITH